MVIRWAYVKELAMADTGRDEDKGFIRFFVIGNKRKEYPQGEKQKENVTSVLVS